MQEDLGKLIFGDQYSSGSSNSSKDYNKKDKPNEFAKEEEYESKNLYPVRQFKLIMIIASVCDLGLWYLIKIYKLFVSLADKIPSFVFFILPVITILCLILIREVKADIWVSHVCGSRIGASYAKFGIKNITVDYDIINQKKDIKKCIQEMTDKSDDYNYYLKGVYPRFSIVKISVGKKVRIPEKAIFDDKIWNSEKWNYIPLGICLTDTANTGIIAWNINDNEGYNEEYYNFYKSIPSVSFLVSGGTGSGKSVCENNIVRHINTYNNNIQGLLCDQKQVEFSPYTDLQGIKAVGLDIPTIKDCLVNARDIMYQRFKFMETLGINNIYKADKDLECDYFILPGVKMSEIPDGKIQFDEIFYCKINGETRVTTIDKIYNAIRSGDKVEVYLLGQKEKPYIIQLPEEETRKEYIIGGDSYSEDDSIDVEVNGQPRSLKPQEIITLLDSGMTIEIPETL